MIKSRVSDIKRAQKESALLRILSQMFRLIASDDSRLTDIFINRVALSADKGICAVFFYSLKGEEHFKEMLEILKLYKPSMRKALAHEIPGRYTPELVFRYDMQFEKQQRLEELIEKVKKEEA